MEKERTQPTPKAAIPPTNNSNIEHNECAQRAVCYYCYCAPPTIHQPNHQPPTNQPHYPHTHPHPHTHDHQPNQPNPTQPTLVILIITAHAVHSRHTHTYPPTHARTHPHTPLTIPAPPPPHHPHNPLVITSNSVPTRARPLITLYLLLPTYLHTSRNNTTNHCVYPPPSP
jgi:hypothetical protein